MSDPIRDDRSLEEVVAGALHTAMVLLGELPDSPQTRELQALARTYERALAQWATVPPRNVQVDALLELVSDLYQSVAAIRQQTSSEVP